MRRMPKHLRPIWWLSLLALLLAGCNTSADPDKAGGTEEPVVLRMANGYANLDYEPAVAYFVDRVAEVSEGALRIEVLDEWGGLATDFEQQIIRGVAAGDVDLGWVGTRIFDTMDVLSLQALTAPMLIDNYPLQEAVIDSGIPEQMLGGLDEIGLRGLAVLADGLRKPIAVDSALLGPDDWSGITFQSFRSEGQAEAIRALGAEATDVVFAELSDGLANGEIQGFEKNLLVYSINTMAAEAPYITTNVNLWPQTVAIFANPERLAELSAQHQEWLTTAADDAAGLSTSLADQDAAMVAGICESGGRFESASAADLTALRQAFDPVYAALRQDSQTAGFIDQIETMKQSTPSGNGLVVPATCTGVTEAPVTPGAGQPVAELDGVYRWTLTEDDALASGTGPTTAEHLATFPWVFTVTLNDGKWDLTVRIGGEDFPQASNQPFAVSGDRIILTWDNSDLVFTYTVDEEGSLHMEPVEPMDAGDQFAMGTYPWTKIE